MFWDLARFEVNSLLGRRTKLYFASDLRIFADKKGNSSSRVVFARIPDWPEMLIWQGYLDEKSYFFDVGANVGLYSLLAARTGAFVSAFEPAHDMAARTREHGLLNQLRNIDVHEVALMDRSGCFSLSGPDANRQRIDSNLSDGSIVGRPLDTYLDGIERLGIKIDVEGNERLVLEGATEALALPGLVEIIQIEWNDLCEVALGESRRPVQDLLLGFGFQFWRSDGSHKMARLNQEFDIPYGRDVFAVRGSAVRFVETFRMDENFAYQGK